jgi:putative endonuclease
MYVGLTRDLSRRTSEHKDGAVSGFTKRYKVTHLVYAEEFSTVDEARAREHTLKRWRREWKFKFIEKQNPDWKDLTASLA